MSRTAIFSDNLQQPAKNIPQMYLQIEKLSVVSASVKAWDNEYFNNKFAGKIVTRHGFLAGHRCDWCLTINILRSYYDSILLFFNT